MSYEVLKFPDGSYRRVWRNASCDYHRELAPAIISYHTDGYIIGESFYFHGRMHREDGPAHISYYPDGSTEREWFYLNGEFLGYNEEGFWVLWDNLNEDKRRSPEILKRLSGFS
jgi:hypothetical protein